VLSEKLVRTHRLTQSRYHVPGEIPVIQLNFTALSHELNLDRDLVEASIKEVVNALSHNIEQSRSCEFAFTTIGNLTITNGTARMRFLPTFLEKMGQMEGTACLLENRPDTGNSVLSDKSIVLPKIQPGKDIKVTSPVRTTDLYVLKEEDANNDSSKDLLDERNCTNGKISPRELGSPKQKLLRKREVLTPTIKVEMNSHEEQPPSSAPEARRHIKRAVVVRDPRSECGPRQTSSIALQPKPSKASLLNLLTNKPAVSSPRRTRRVPSKEKEQRCENCAEHMNDFCYLCFQREQRNIPTYFNEERKNEEEDEDRLLQAYTLLKDKEALQQEQEKKNKNREDAQAIAAFNLGVAEALKKKKVVRPGKFERSYVFRNRCITPPHFIKQEDYQEDLAQQVSDKKKRNEMLKHEQDNIERVEQLKLAEELAAQWECYLRNKGLQSESYRNALDAQVHEKNRIELAMNTHYLDGKRSYSLPHPNVVLPFQKNIRVSTNATDMMAYRSSELPAAYSDSDGPIFGVCDTNDKKRMERRKRAQLLYQNQVEMAAQKREMAMSRSANVKKEEEELLRKTKAELLEETLIRNSLNLQQRKELEKTWAVHDMKKKAKELEEKLRTRSPGLLLQEQCDKYASCDQCTRKQTNYGRSNVWSESRYVSGSRLMV